MANAKPADRPSYWCSTCQRGVRGDVCGVCGSMTIFVSPKKLAQIEKAVRGRKEG